MEYALIDFRTSDNEKKNLNKLGFKTILCPPCKNVCWQICGHPDISVFFIDKKTAVVDKNTDIDFLKKLNSININVIPAKNPLSQKYPGDISLNALNLDKIFVHNLKYTDPSITKNLGRKKLINVNQGYTKCSSSVIGKNNVITSDPSIYNALSEQDIDVMQIPFGDILLDGFDYGFIGGCCGSFENYAVFFGSLENYAYGKNVLEFLEKHNIKPIYLSNEKLTDRGSIFFI